MFKESRLNIQMIITVLLFSAVYSEKKPDFGALTACVKKNKSLMVDCSYPVCDSTPFNCNIYDVEGNMRKLIGSSDWALVNSTVSYLNATSGVCRLIIKDHATIYLNKTKIYACSLTRKTSKEERTLTVKYSTRKERPKDCPSGGPCLHISILLWSITFIFFQECKI